MTELNEKTHSRKRTHERDRCLYNCYHILLTNCVNKHIPVRKDRLVADAIIAGRPRYPFHPDTAERVVSRLDRHGTPEGPLTPNKQLWLDFYEKVKQCRKNHPSWATRLVVAYVLQNKTSDGFYVSIPHAKRIISRVEAELAKSNAA